MSRPLLGGFRRTGVDTLDLLLDLVVLPDLSWYWKDEDEYDHARRTGVITGADAAAIGEAREQAVALVERGGPPFTSDWRDWRPSSSWATPTLPGAHREEAGEAGEVGDAGEVRS